MVIVIYIFFFCMDDCYLHIVDFGLSILQVESIRQYIEGMKTAYLADQRRRGDGNDPFLEG